MRRDQNPDSVFFYGYHVQAWVSMSPPSAVIGERPLVQSDSAIDDHFSQAVEPNARFFVVLPPFLVKLSPLADRRIHLGKVWKSAPNFNASAD